MRCLLLLVSICFGAAAQAQYKCIAPDGVLEYRATPCPGTPEAKRLETQRAAQRDRADKQSAQRSQDDWQRRARDLDQREAARKADEASIQGRRQEQSATDARRPKAVDPLDSGAAIQAAADKAAAIKQAKADKAARALSIPLAADPPSLITNCDPGGCWDNLGNRYNGSGQTLFRTDGRVCQKQGPMLHCN